MVDRALSPGLFRVAAARVAAVALRGEADDHPRRRLAAPGAAASAAATAAATSAVASAASAAGAASVAAAVAAFSSPTSAPTAAATAAASLISQAVASSDWLAAAAASAPAATFSFRRVARSPSTVVYFQAAVSLAVPALVLALAMAAPSVAAYSCKVTAR